MPRGRPYISRRSVKIGTDSAEAWLTCMPLGFQWSIQETGMYLKKLTRVISPLFEENTSSLTEPVHLLLRKPKPVTPPLSSPMMHKNTKNDLRMSHPESISDWIN